MYERIPHPMEEVFFTANYTGSLAFKADEDHEMWYKVQATQFYNYYLIIHGHVYRGDANAFALHKAGRINTQLH